MATTNFIVLNTKKLYGESSCEYIVVPKDFDIKWYKLLGMNIINIGGENRYMKIRPRYPVLPTRVDGSSLYSTLKMRTDYSFIPIVDQLTRMAADHNIVDESGKHKVEIEKLYNIISADKTMLGEADLYESKFRILHSAGVINTILNNSLTRPSIDTLYSIAHSAMMSMISTSKQQSLIELKKDIYATTFNRLGYYADLHYDPGHLGITYGQYVDISIQPDRYNALRRINYYITSEVGVNVNRFSDVYVPLYLSKNSGTYGNSKTNMLYYYDMCIMASEGTFTANNSGFESKILSFNLINSLSDIFSNSSELMNSKNQDIYNATNRIEDVEENIVDIPEDVPVELPGVLTVHFPDKNVNATHYTLKVIELRKQVETDKYDHNLFRIISGQNTKVKLIRSAIETRQKHMEFDRGKYIYSTTDNVASCDIPVNAGDLLAIYVRAESDWLSSSYSEPLVVNVNKELVVNLPGKTPGDLEVARGRYLNAIYRKKERKIVNQIDETVRLFKAGLLGFVTYEEAGEEISKNI